MRRCRRPSLNAQERPDGKLNGMEYKNYEEWGADAQKIQADLEDADRKLKQALIDGDEEASPRYRAEYDSLIRKSRDHMAKRPLKVV